MNKHTQSANTSGISRLTKRQNRHKKKAQYLQNAAERAASQSNPKGNKGGKK